MKSSWLLAMALVTTAGLGNELRADMGPPFFPRNKTQVRVRFENLSEFPEFDFYLKTHGDIIAEGQAHRLRKITTPDLTYLFSWGDLGPTYLVALPRGQKISLPEERAEVREWVSSQLSGTLQSDRLSGTEGVLSRADDGGELIYRVAINGERLTVELSQANLPPKVWRWVSLGILTLVFLTIILAIGLGLMYRRIKRTAPSSAGKM